VVLTLLLAPALSTAVGCDGASDSIVLIGATGSLAKKYLWQALFDVWAASAAQCGDAAAVHVFAGARTRADDGAALVQSIVLDTVACDAASAASCDALKRAFVKRVQYVQLDATPEAYTALARTIEVRPLAHCVLMCACTSERLLSRRRGVRGCACRLATRARRAGCSSSPSHRRSSCR
jgi:glucose-6-phosphate 1-dehydrogenase